MVSSPSLSVPSGSSSPWWSQVKVYLFLVVALHLGVVQVIVYMFLVVVPHLGVVQVIVYLFLVVAPHLGGVKS